MVMLRMEILVEQFDRRERIRERGNLITDSQVPVSLIET